MPSVSIIVPTYNRAMLLRKALETVAALSVPEGWRADVLVIDNNSQDQTAAVVEEQRVSFPLSLRRVVEMKQGLNHARNRGMREARGDWLVYLDDDIKVGCGWLHAFADAAESLEPDAVVGPVYPWFDGDVPPWCTGRVLESVTSAYSRKGDETIVLSANKAHELPGCNFAVRRSLAYEVGGFHPALDRSGAGMLAGGDFEFGRRISRSGGRVLYIPGCRIEHLISEGKMSKKGLRERWYGTGRTIKTVQKIYGESFSSGEKCHMLGRLARLYARSALQSATSADTSLRWELEALKLRGLLFGRVAGLEDSKLV